MGCGRMASAREIWAVVPVKETAFAKQRLAKLLPPETRRELALAMLEDVLQSVSAVRELSGIVVVTLDPDAAELANRWGARVWTEGARDGHAGAVTAAARRLADHGAAMLTIPGDVPLVTPPDFREIISAHRSSPSFVIVPARDELGSNAILCSPPNHVPLRFGANSYFPHLDAARAHGVEPTTVRLPRIALDVDEPDDLIEFMRVPSSTRARELAAQFDLGIGSAGPTKRRAVT
jgi:2-phospho-L-lactate guanylyltransferase